MYTVAANHEGAAANGHASEQIEADPEPPRVGVAEIADRLPMPEAKRIIATTKPMAIRLRKDGDKRIGPEGGRSSDQVLFASSFGFSGRASACMDCSAFAASARDDSVDGLRRPRRSDCAPAQREWNCEAHGRFADTFHWRRTQPR